MSEPILYRIAMWLCKALGHFTTGGWVNYGMFHQECRICGKIISESIQETEMAKEPMFTDREWAEAIMFGFKGLTLEEVEDIIKSNITITDSRLYEGVYAVAVDIEVALKNKNAEHEQ